MKLSLRLFLLPLLPAFASAGNTITGVIAVPFHAQRSTAIALAQPADYLCATVSISSHEKDVARQAEHIREAVRQVSSAVAKAPLLQLHDGPLRFNASSRIDLSGGSSLSSWSSYSKSGPSFFGTSLRVLYKLDGSGRDVFVGAAALRKFVDDLKMPALSEARLGSITLAVEAPERQRERLLSLIRESAEAMKKTFNADQVIIGGLDGPVLVRQSDDAFVELFIDYELSVSSGQSATTSR